MSITDAKFRLPTNVKPVHYNIIIKTDLEKLEFQGLAIINLEVLEDTSSLTFNLSHATTTEISVHSENLKTEQIETAKTSFDEKAERATVQLSNVLTKGSKAQLKVQYESKLTDSLMGYYYSTYQDQGVKKQYTLTQFESTAARRAFPCWDEPLLKATYSITLVSRDNTVNLSNMPAISEQSIKASGLSEVQKLFKNEDTAGWKVTRFETTPPMSSYIVAFANGPFKYLESSYKSPLSGKTRALRIYATSDLIDQAQFGLDVKAKVLPHYERVFDVEFPLPKLDTLVAHDFDAGAMENWGLITGRTNAYLVDPKRADITALQQIAGTQSHEVAHMWFGNITTMSWWDNLWLNEGFASLMGEVIILNKIYPEWNVYSSFYADHTEEALTLDAKPSSHPIQVDVPDANDIGQIFDALSYSKAAAVLRMLSVYAGEEKFLKGVSIYLKKHLYANSVAEDLWNGIQEATNLDIPALMTNWISKIGFPVITVTETPEGIHIRQDRFLDTGKASDADNQTIWQVPLFIMKTDADGKTVIDNQALLTTREMTYKLDVNKPWKLNAGAVGFYRVLYTPDRLSKLGAEVASPNSVLSVTDRLSIVSDAMVLASSGLAKTSGALTVIDSLRSESQYLVWKSSGTQLSRLSQTWWEENPGSDDVKALLRSVFTPIVRKLGYEYPKGENVETSQLRTLAISSAAGADSKEVISKLKGWFDEFVATGSDMHIPPDLIRSTYITGGRYGGKREWDALYKAYCQPINPTSQNAGLIALCRTKDPELIEKSLNLMLEELPTQDLYKVFFSVGLNVTAGRRMMEFFLANYDALCKRVDGTFQVSYFLRGASALLNSEKDAQNLEAFFKDRDTSKISLILPQTLDTIRARAAWLERSRDDVSEWFETWKKVNEIEPKL
ncbi:peptidase family M1-domain-containing protein [Hysterangium stoloniferum]|nr:peptidase family M1-domain-containing protein [Hysterangium stoloniferum]